MDLIQACVHYRRHFQNILTPIDLVIGIADAYTLAYNVLENQFELTLFYADCCDNAIYVFKNQNNN